MQYIEGQYINWDKIYLIPLTLSNLIKKNDKLIVNFEWGNEIVRVINVITEKKDIDIDQGVEILRLANREDISLQEQLYKESREVLEFCHDHARQLNLPMKLVDAHFSFDKKRLVFAFIAQGRVDFRVLIKELTKRYRGSIRLQQIGVRDEAKISGDIGACGYRLCCQSHLRNLGNIYSEMASNQKISQRGIDRLSGICGRLKCCLAFEEKNYQQLK